MEPESNPADDGAEQAFTALRDEVAALRQAVETTQATLTNQAATAPDYSPTLGTMIKELQKVTERLVAIEAHPALELTPEQHAQRLTSAGAGLLQDAAHRLDHAARDTEHERDRLAGLIGTVRRQDEQRIWVFWTGCIAFASALLLAPVLAAALPFGLDGQVAALVMRDDRWHAGSALMQAASPDGWTDLALASNLAHDNETVLKACRAAAEKTGKAQRCAISVPVP